MKTMIYYFTGTGNSLRAARIIAKELGEAELVSMKQDPDKFPAKNADVIGFVCPVYEWDIPEAVKQFVKALTVNPMAYFFMAVTYSMVHGKCFESMNALLKEKGTYLSYSKGIHSVASQCIAYEPFPKEKYMIPYSEKAASMIGKNVTNRKTNRFPRMSFITRRLYPKIILPYVNIQAEYDKGFYTSDACAGCGVCSQVCPVSNIKIEQGRPVFLHHCISCNACVVYCPKKAIQFTKPQAYEHINNIVAKRLCLPENRKRYHNPFISIKDMVSQYEIHVIK